MALPDVNPSLVPARRLGAALHAHRTSTGSTVVSISRQCEGWWAPDELLDVERGRHALDDASVVALCRLYGLPARGLGDVASLELVLDRSDAAELMAPGTEPPTDRRGSTERALLRFVALTRVVGLDARAVGSTSLALSEALDISPSTILSSIDELLAGSEVSGAAALLEDRVAVPAVGLCVASTGEGVLVLVRKAGGGVRPSPEPVPAAGPLRWFAGLPVAA